MDVWQEEVVLTRRDFAVAEALARDLAQDVDRNELGKVIAYFKRERSKDKLLDLLERLPRSGYVRSGRTADYLRRIRHACERHLGEIEGDRRALAILGWAFRLMTRYQTQRGTRYGRDRARSR